MHDLKHPRAIVAKGIMFLLIGILAVVLILLELPSLRVAILLMLTIWAFCRFYYFAFYVVHHYVDPSYRYAGLLSLLRHAWRRPR